jgi:predicted TIM-barrel fold metal-dependent hydrolase
MTVIDLQAHARSDAYDTFLAARGLPVGPRHGIGGGTDDAELEDRLRVMDEGGVDIAAISIGGTLPCFDDTSMAVAAAQMINDEFHDLARRGGGRLPAVATIPLPDVDAALAEVARALDQLGCCAVGITTTVAGRALSDPSFEPLFHELNRRGAAVILHPLGASAAWPAIGDFGMALNATMGMLIEDTVAVGHLILGGMPLRYPDLKLVVPHLGGMTPILPRRLDNLAEMLRFDLEEPPSVTLGRIWYDTVAHAHLPALQCAVDTVGAAQLVFGTDHPIESAATVAESIAQIDQLGLSAADAEAIRSGNARALLALA